MIDRTPKPCHHPVANHQHGDLYAYVKDECRCLPCEFTHAEYRKQMRKRRLTGRGPTFVDAELARRHVNALRAAGWGQPRIIAESGISQGSLQRLLYGTDGSPTSRRVNQRTHDALMALPIPDPLDGHHVPTLGVRRRVRALAYLGWALVDVATNAGLARDTITKATRSERCLPSTHRAVADAYERLWNKHPPAATPHQRRVVSRQKNKASRLGWAPPMAWDDDNIDDPNATPNTGDAQRDAESHEAERLALWKRGMTDRQIAAATGRHHDAIRRWRLRHGLPSQERRAAS